jgi:hypothetical protein
MPGNARVAQIPQRHLDDTQKYRWRLQLQGIVKMAQALHVFRNGRVLAHDLTK